MLSTRSGDHIQRRESPRFCWNSFRFSPNCRSGLMYQFGTHNFGFFCVVSKSCLPKEVDQRNEQRVSVVLPFHSVPGEAK